jgi:hypothetical protein
MAMIGTSMSVPGRGQAESVADALDGASERDRSVRCLIGDID